MVDNIIISKTATPDLPGDFAGGAINILSNGFQIIKSDGDVNNSGTTFIYIAFAENPFKYALAR